MLKPERNNTMEKYDFPYGIVPHITPQENSHVVGLVIPATGAVSPIPSSINWPPRDDDRKTLPYIPRVLEDADKVIINPTSDLPKKKHSHYFKDVSKIDTIDVYRVLSLFNVTDPCLQHAIKKLLVAGGRGAKDINKDVQEAIDTLIRFQAIRNEDCE